MQELAEQKAEITRAKRIKRPRVDKARKKRYQKARSKLGLSPNATGSMVWSELAAATSFIWKYDTLAENARWCIIESFKAMHLHPISDRAQVALHYASRAFGIARPDLLGLNRAPPIVMARYIAMVTVRRTGVGRNDTARRFNRDQTVVKLAEKKVGHFFEGIKFDDYSLANTGTSGLTPDGQSDGGLPS
jgi:hypothetical protein